MSSSRGKFKYLSDPPVVTAPFTIDLDENKCIGCGLCVKVCVGNCYEMKMVPEREVTVAINGKQKTLTVKKIAILVNPDNCMGDCHCHKICPVDGAAMGCKPKMTCCID